MIGLTKKKQIIDYLDELIPNPKSELKYDKDYELLLAVMMSAQTTDVRVNQVNAVLFKKYPTLEELDKADIIDIEEIIRPIGTYIKKAKNIKMIVRSLINDQNSLVPNNRAYLENLSGVGRKTANVVLGILFNENVVAVDTHVKRISYRLGIADKNDNPLQVEEKIIKNFPETNLNRLHQQFVLFGRHHCKAVKPLCEQCKLKNICKEKSR